MNLAAYFRRGQHRVRGPYSITVADLTATLDEELNRRHPTGFHLSADGKFLVWNGTVHIPDSPDDPSNLVLMIEPAGALVDMPKIDDTVDLTVLHKDNPRQPEAAFTETEDGRYRLSLALREGEPPPFGPRQAPGPDGVVCEYGCDAWSIDSRCPQHVKGPVL